MKKILTSITLMCAIILTSFAQEKPSPAKELKFTQGDLSVTINYSSPAVKGRKIFGELVPFGQVWRTGANEATTVEFSRDVKVEGKSLSAGTYALFTIPNKNEWVIIFNEEPKQWGAYNYKEAKDALRVNAKPVALDENIERLTFAADKGLITISWADTKVSFKVE